ncbi:YfdX family protein [Phaeobacter sp. HF9A]|uniref:YfdX family protein n=1 Tax=Phaeobacter sp. HF9A TaxID=2721561 RepID=UPI00142F9061|nr:YfdX family protein [Phaeobacter sp. HF9A]NIZ12950.1 YfdX family protein [Phaeobacter sp. HF9A]
MIGTKLKTLAVVALMSTSALTPAYASTAAAPGYATQAKMLQTADEAVKALGDAHAARIALFDNDIPAAKEKIDQAVKLFTMSEKRFNDLTIGDTEEPELAARFLPIDSAMSLSETYKPTDDSKAALDKAQDLMQQGKTDDALNVLRLASVDVNVQTALLPIDSVTTQLNEAKAQIDKGDYYTANLTLKELEVPVLMRSYSVDAIPQQGTSD